MKFLERFIYDVNDLGLDANFVVSWKKTAKNLKIFPPFSNYEKINADINF